MRISFDQIKEAMISLANQKGRPHYELSLIKEVAQAIHNNTPHHLKQIVLQEVYVLFNHLYQEEKKEEEYDAEEILKKLTIVRTLYAGQKALVSRSKVSGRTISLLIRGEYSMTPRILNKIGPVIDDVIKELTLHHIEKERQSHGNYVTYRNGCRCALCKLAWREYAQKGKQRKKEKELLETEAAKNKEAAKKQPPKAK